MNKDFRKLEDLKNWEKNPRSIKGQDFNRLKKQIQDLGQYKPLLITSDGIVLGGNMRLRAYKDLGIKDIWVSTVEAPTEEKKLEFALSDNDRAGYYDQDLLANLMPEYPDFDWGQYAVDLNPPSPLDLLAGLEAQEIKGEIEFTQELMEASNYVVLYFNNEIDWLQLQSIFPLPVVKALDAKSGYERSGVGRVVDGIEFIKKVKDN